MKIRLLILLTSSAISFATANSLFGSIIEDKNATAGEQNNTLNQTKADINSTIGINTFSKKVIAPKQQKSEINNTNITDSNIDLKVVQNKTSRELAKIKKDLSNTNKEVLQIKCDITTLKKVAAKLIKVNKIQSSKIKTNADKILEQFNINADKILNNNTILTKLQNKMNSKYDNNVSAKNNNLIKDYRDRLSRLENKLASITNKNSTKNTINKIVKILPTTTNQAMSIKNIDNPEKGSYKFFKYPRFFKIYIKNTHCFAYPNIHAPKIGTLPYGKKIKATKYTKAGWLLTNKYCWIKGYKVSPKFKGGK